MRTHSWNHREILRQNQDIGRRATSDAGTRANRAPTMAAMPRSNRVPSLNLALSHSFFIIAKSDPRIKLNPPNPEAHNMESHSIFNDDLVVARQEWTMMGWHPLLIPKDCLNLIFKEVILDSGYSRAVAVCKWWRCLMPDAYLDAVDEIRARSRTIHTPVNVYLIRSFTKSDDILRSRGASNCKITSIHHLFSTTHDIARPVWYRSGCLSVAKRRIFLDQDRTMRFTPSGCFDIEITFPFGRIIFRIVSIMIARWCPHSISGIQSTRCEGALSKRRMRKIAHRLLPHLDIINTSAGLYWQYDDCVGFNRGNDRITGHSDARAGLTPDETDNEDYMYGYNSYIRYDIAAMPDEILITILSLAILDGGYSRAVAVCRKWKGATRKAFFTLTPHFRAQLFCPTIRPHLDWRLQEEGYECWDEDVFGIPRFEDHQSSERGEDFIMVTIPGCISVRRESRSNSHHIELYLHVRVPFGSIGIDFTQISCTCRGGPNIIRISDSTGDRVAMARLPSLIFPDLRDTNLYQSQDCVICVWQWIIPGCVGFHNARLGWSDSEDGCEPDMPDDEFYMIGYMGKKWSRVVRAVEKREEIIDRKFAWMNKKRSTLR